MHDSFVSAMRLILCFLLFILFGCTEEKERSLTSSPLYAPKETSVPLLRDSTDRLVHLSIGSLDSLRFGLDSGSPVMLMSASLHRRLDSIASASVVGSGEMGPDVGLDSFGIGSVTIGRTVAAVTTPPYTVQRRWHDGQPYDGILGWSVLDSLDLAYDLSRQRLHLFRRSTHPPKQSPVWSVVPDSFVCDSFPYLHGSGETAQLTVDGETFPVVLDTGASPSVLSWRVARAAGITKGHARQLNEKVLGLDTSSAVGPAVQIATLGDGELGKVPLDTAQVRISDLSWFQQKDYEALIGNDLVEPGIVVRADSADRRLQYVCRPDQ